MNMHTHVQLKEGVVATALLLTTAFMHKINKCVEMYLDEDIAGDVALVNVCTHALHCQVLLLPEFCILKLWGTE